MQYESFHLEGGDRLCIHLTILDCHYIHLNCPRMSIKKSKCMQVCERLCKEIVSLCPKIVCLFGRVIHIT